MKSSKETKNIASTVRTLISPLAQEMGYQLWDVEFVKEGADKYLRITIDNDEGITIEDCERFHRGIDPLLDEADPIEEAYILEVSSPGIERELKYDEHIEASVGLDVEVRLFAPLCAGGAKQFRGILIGLDDDGNVEVEISGDTVTFPREKIAKIQTVYDFGD